MDGKVNLAGPTADINWPGLVDLYNVNESIYAYRHNYRLSQLDWVNYLKDVDRVFALLNSHHEQNRRNQTKTAQSDGSLAVSPEPAEMGSAEPDEDPRHVDAPHFTLPADLSTLHWNQPTFSPERTLEWNNDIPEVSRLDSEHWRNLKTEKQMGQEGIGHFDGGFSGNSMMELALQPGNALRPDGARRGDAFQDQLHLPVYSDETAVRQMVSVSTVQPPVHRSSTGRTSHNVEERPNGGRLPEGSASQPRSSD
ncbi:PREDICTED: uncharacterized protein LOC102858392 [Elephantulus edwardii]|uniref:uncharacterized protein LOC102858392 n=1 Tax=Elephantulus edwardii TaxID=28737 RepID=UPI0003F0738C|nr:PREDICTED: uncharacterized protein LOC102858392 [Elephantulus edwardii]